MPHVFLCRASVSPEYPAGQKNSAVKWEASATRAFSLNASDEIKTLNLSSQGPKQDSGPYVRGPGALSLGPLVQHLNASCKTQCGLQPCSLGGGAQGRLHPRRASLPLCYELFRGKITLKNATSFSPFLVHM